MKPSSKFIKISPILIFIIFLAACKPPSPDPTTSPIETELIPTPQPTPTPTYEFPDDPLYQNMVFVPGGEFLMGCDPEHNGGLFCSEGDMQIHPVFLDGFFIDKFEVTNAQYAQCVADGMCDTPHEIDSETRDAYYGNPEFATYPVIFVDWDDADTFCNWAGKQLPTEAQWEKAARGTSPSGFPWGDEEPTCSLTNAYDQTNDNYCVGDTTEVGTYPEGSSDYGALDMAGNVYEWVADWYSEDDMGPSHNENPTGPESGIYKVLRGGSWNNSWYYLRVSYRSKGSEFPDYYGDNIGFRCAAPMP